MIYFLTKFHKPNHEKKKKNTGQIPTEGHPEKCLTNPFQNCQGHQKHGMSEK